MRRADSRNRRHKTAEEHVSVALRLAYLGLRRSCGTVPLTSARGLSFPSTIHARAHKTGCRAHTIPAATIQGTKGRIRTQMAHTSGTNSEQYNASSWRESVALRLRGRKEGGRKARKAQSSLPISLPLPLSLSRSGSHPAPTLAFAKWARERGREAERERRREQERGREKERQELGEPNPVR